MSASIEGTRQALIDALDPLIPERARCALIDFPAHPNVGDSAIWLGERAYLRQRGVNVAYTCDIKNYSKSHLERSIGDGTILINGGGNSVTSPHHHALRMRVSETFRGNGSFNCRNRLISRAAARWKNRSAPSTRTPIS